MSDVDIITDLPSQHAIVSRLTLNPAPHAAPLIYVAAKATYIHLLHGKIGFFFGGGGGGSALAP